MFSGITNLIFGTTDSSSGASTSSVDLHFSDAEDEWVLVDINLSAQDKMSNRDLENHLPKLVLQLNFDSPLKRPVSASSPTPSTLSPCPIPDNVSPDSSWFITPPPCFTAGGHAPIEIIANPMENLFIEHPSMSVYGLRQRNRSTGSDSHRSESSSSDSSRILSPSPTVVHHSSRHPSAVAAMACMVARLENIKAMQKSENHFRTHKLRRSQLERTNKVQEFNAHGKRNRRKNFMAHPSGRSNNRKC